ncbi:D-methionine transport system permease protein [Actinobaculum suis]|uniref:D-methionine transport system permease protein n=1 Tax=Actinobaculum suis TaxID=1657 RepID=A0A0K9EVC6_9ACTO|nr:methionine ABC transporter permease [Actinobaculum suis]KMY23860.1 ABC transporter permease [Actinobaculum suis]MDY5153573.1 methionine ABC transporter permease [Actinobaculum suis]SDE24902.1 D-methionine transport system permease protein [Actinobaculum suis]
MHDFLVSIIPNVMARLPEFYQAIIDTIVMTVWSGVISFLLGLIFGIVLVVTKPGGILQNAPLYQFTDKVTNIFRSIPFIVLLTAVMPLSRLIMGTAIGVEGAIVPLVFGCTPFFTRQVESALSQVDPGLVEAAQAMGKSAPDIIWNVYLKESIAPLARATTITTISLIGLTAMAGAVGAGGLGNFAIQYGHDRNMLDVTWVTVLVLILMVSIVQIIGNRIARKNTWN